MKRIALIAFLIWPAASMAELGTWRQQEPATVFSGREQTVQVMFHNSGNAAVKETPRYRIFQASSSTLMPLGPAIRWKLLEVLPEQTILETVPVTIPAVKSITRFQIHWLDESGKSKGHTEFVAYPVDPLANLKALARDHPPGIFDPEARIIPQLKELQVHHVALADEAALSEFNGRWVFFAPATLSTAALDKLTPKLLARARGGLSVIHLQPDDKLGHFAGTMEIFHMDRGLVVKTQERQLKDMLQSPRAQQHLARLSEIALNADSHDRFAFGTLAPSK
jgi:hypothetical protein